MDITIHRDIPSLCSVSAVIPLAHFRAAHHLHTNPLPPL